MVSTDTRDVTEDTALKIPVDAEHGRMRLAVILIFIVALIIGYVVLSLIFPEEGVNLIAIAGSFIVAAIFTQLVERYMKERWPSGRVLEMSADTIQLTKNGKTEIAIDPQKQVNLLQWRFTIKRRARVKKGWYVVSCTLEQDQVLIPIYTFASPEDFEQLTNQDKFVRLLEKKEVGTGGNERDMRLAGQQRRLHNAEQQRWLMGAEMSLEAFKEYMQYLETHYEKWMTV